MMRQIHVRQLTQIQSAAYQLARSERGVWVLKAIAALLAGPASGLDSTNRLAMMLLLTVGTGDKPTSVKDAIAEALGE